jgi:flagellar hook-basal body complex protein FliE
MNRYMLNPISMQLPQVPQASPLSMPGSPIVSGSGSQANGMFNQMLMNAMGNIANQQSQVESLVEDHLLGRSVTDVEVLTAIKQAELTLKTMLQVRNKAVEAYKELKQIQV